MGLGVRPLRLVWLRVVALPWAGVHRGVRHPGAPRVRAVPQGVLAMSATGLRRRWTGRSQALIIAVFCHVGRGTAFAVQEQAAADPQRETREPLRLTMHESYFGRPKVNDYVFSITLEAGGAAVWHGSNG